MNIRSISSCRYLSNDFNDENIFVLGSAYDEIKVCREYVGEFKRLEKGQFGRGALGDVPETIDLKSPG